MQVQTGRHLSDLGNVVFIIKLHSDQPPALTRAGGFFLWRYRLVKNRISGLFLVFLLLVSVSFLPQTTRAESPKAIDKARCGEMIRFGKQAYDRGRFLDAKSYFRQAVQADSASDVAWHYYDLSVVSALAEKVNKDSSLLAPDVSQRGQAQSSSGAASPPPPPPAPAPVKKKIIPVEEDEGC